MCPTPPTPAPQHKKNFVHFSIAVLKKTMYQNVAWESKKKTLQNAFKGGFFMPFFQMSLSKLSNLKNWFLENDPQLIALPQLLIITQVKIGTTNPKRQLSSPI